MNNIITETDVKAPVKEVGKMSAEEFKAVFKKEEKKVIEYFVEFDERDDEEIEADEIIINGPFVIFRLEGDIVLIAPERQLVRIKQLEE